MNPARFQQITDRYKNLRIGLIGDLCLDRYFEIDPDLVEISIETGLPVHNVTHVRCQPGAAGTILNNLAALGVGEIYPAAIIGEDGEGFELRRALARRRGTRLDYIVESSLRHTFTYSKPLVVSPGKIPVELSRLDIKNWTVTPDSLQESVVRALRELAGRVDAFIILDQVDIAETGVVTAKLLMALREIVKHHPNLFIIADSRRGLKNYPPVCLKMNAAELAALTETNTPLNLDEVKERASRLSLSHPKPVFVSMAEKGIVCAHQGEVLHSPAFPLRGEIDIVGAGDSVTANLAVALAVGATLRESLELAMLASSIVIHQLGTTGAATIQEMCLLLKANPPDK